ncbi:MAG TPA: UDP-N-acetylmuramate--L-alanine ligase [Bacteroidia bacterium]|nr:UDP-N-acetylmuramate--L-alanine ligase [Bacteroidia bacterium]
MKHFYFIGIGGIGMSALARFFHASGKSVAGYDKTPSSITDELQREGIPVHFEDEVKKISDAIKNDPAGTLVVWTPAVPEDHNELSWFRSNKYRMMKRAEVLGLITSDSTTIAIAGTHGKTTTTTLTAHLLRSSGIDCSAFLGGISGNYNTNLLLGDNLGKDVPKEKNIVVAEADEFDRSFLWLHPAVAVMTSVDADHLDIYKNPEAMYDSYRQFASQVTGTLVAKDKVIEKLGLKQGNNLVSYSLESERTDAFAKNIRIENGQYVFDLNYKGKTISDLRLGLPGRHNVENAVAAVSAVQEVGINDESVREALHSFKGVARRFDYRFRSDKVVYIDDYGHHPAELRACISSARELFPGKKITGIFQPHLFSRTKDFANEFAESLSLLDDVVLLDIYPAREKPIPGITSSMLLDKITSKKKNLYSKEELVSKVMQHDFDVLITMGAGDIDRFVAPFEKALLEKFGSGRAGRKENVA